MATLKLSCSHRAVAASAYVNTNWRFTQTLQRRQQLQLQQQLCRRLSAAATAAAQTPTTTAMPKSHANVRDFSNSKRSKSCSSSSKPKLVSVQEARRFMIDCFKAVNVPQKHAEAQADLLVAADHCGHFSHGMNRLEMYVDDVKNGATDGCAGGEIIKETPATAWVDGHNGLGAVVGIFCMDLAIKKAKDVGVGWVCAKTVNHYGMAGWYVIRAMDQGLVGMSMTNTSPLMAPTGAMEAALGTNPLSMGAPSAKGDKFLLDMATTAVALGKIEMQRRKKEPLPAGWAQGPDGNITTDAEVAFNTRCLMPLGGAAITSGYKGYGLAAMVDILTGVMAGAKYSTQIREWMLKDASSAADLGQLFVAVDPCCFAPNFEEQLADFNCRLRGAKPTDKCNPVILPGEKEDSVRRATDEAGGIQYVENQIKTCADLATRLGVKHLQFNS